MNIIPDKKALLIINPVSGKKHILNNLTSVIRTLMDGGYLVTAMVTGAAGDASEFAYNLCEDYELICCAGGDGTLNETISGLARKGIHMPLGYIPCGSTNDFAICHQLPVDFSTAASNIAAGHRRSFDIGRFNDRYFTYVAAFGAFSWLSYTTDQNLKNALGHTAYILDGIKDLSKIKPVYMRITADGKTYEGDYLFGAVCNSLSVAGTIELPDSVVDTSDGLFEVLLIKFPGNLIDFDSIIMSLITQDYSNPFIEFFQAADISVVNRDGAEWALDGEQSGKYDTISISPMQGFLTLQG